MLYTYFAGLRIRDFKIGPQCIFAVCNVYQGKEENQQFLSKGKYSGSHLNSYLKSSPQHLFFNNIWRSYVKYIKINFLLFSNSLEEMV